MTFLACLLAACGTSPSAVSPLVTPPDPVSTADPATGEPTPGPTSTVGDGSASPSSTTSTPSIATLEDGRPVTFIAVTDDYEAVEVDTATGEIVHSFGRRADADELASSEEIYANVVDAAWRTRSGESILISECCEPAAGRIAVLTGGAALSPDYSEEALYAWAAVPSPRDDRAIVVGYSTGIVEVNGAKAVPVAQIVENDGSGIGAIGWSNDARLIYWYDQQSGELVTYDPSGPPEDNQAREPMTWIGPDQWLSGLAAQQSGNLVSFLHTFGPDHGVISTEGIVYSPATAEIIARFPVETGARFGGYETSGKFLLYVDADGEVRWQGKGGTGSLGTGFIFASW